MKTVPGTRRSFQWVVPALAALVLVAGSVTGACDQGPTGAWSAPGSPTAAVPSYGRDCDIADVGSGSATDPHNDDIDIPACAPKHYPSTVPGLSGVTPVTAAALAKVDPRALLWAVMKLASTRKVTDLLTEFYDDPQMYTEYFPTGILDRVQIDYPHRAFRFENVDGNLRTGAIDPNDIFLRCVGTTAHLWQASTRQWSTGDVRADAQ